MKLCLPTQNDRGLDAPLAAHFGNAPWLTLVDSETGATTAVANPKRDHGPGGCQAAQTVAKLAVEAVVGGRFGRRAFEALRGAGVAVLVTEGATVAEVMEAFRGGALEALTAEAACRGGRRPRRPAGPSHPEE